MSTCMMCTNMDLDVRALLHTNYLMYKILWINDLGYELEWTCQNSDVGSPTNMVSVLRFVTPGNYTQQNFTDK